MHFLQCRGSSWAFWHSVGIHFGKHELHPLQGNGRHTHWVRCVIPSLFLVCFLNECKEVCLFLWRSATLGHVLKL